MSTPKELAKKKHTLIVDYQKFFTTPSGKKVLQDLIWMHYMPDTFDKDDRVAAYNEGARSVLLRILHLCKTDTKKLIDFIEEVENEHATSYDINNYGAGG